MRFNKDKFIEYSKRCANRMILNNVSCIEDCNYMDTNFNIYGNNIPTQNIYNSFNKCMQKFMQINDYECLDFVAVDYEDGKEVISLTFCKNSFPKNIEDLQQDTFKLKECLEYI